MGEGQPETFTERGCTHDGGQTRQRMVTVEGVRGAHRTYFVSYRKARVAGPPQRPGVVLHAVHRDCRVW
jgi:hypothetical protein